MFCRHVSGNISGGFRSISHFFGNFADFTEKPDFAGPRPREISEALILICPATALFIIQL